MPDNPEKLYAGKYKTPEELEQGLLNMVPEMDRIKREAEAAQARAMQAEAQARAAQEVFTAFQEQLKAQAAPEPALDDVSIQTYIDRKFAAVEKKLESVPGIVDNRLQAILQPFSAAQNAKASYMAKATDYDDGSVNKFLAVNPGINRVFQSLVSNPATAEQAYEYAHGMYKAALPKTSAVDEGKKRDATAPAQASGPSLSTENPDVPTAEQLRAMAQRAQNTYSPEDELALAKATFKGTKLLADIAAMKPDWAKE